MKRPVVWLAGGRAIEGPAAVSGCGCAASAGRAGLGRVARARSAVARVSPVAGGVVVLTIFRNVLEKGRPSVFIESLGLRPLDVDGRKMAHRLEGMGLITMGLAGNGVGHWDFAIGVDQFTG